MRRCLAALVLALLLAPATASATHLSPGLDCAPAAAYLTRIEARIVAQRAAYNATNAALTASKSERDDLAEELVETSEPVDDLTDALADALVGQGSKLADVVEEALDTIDAAGSGITDDEAQDAFFVAYDTLWGFTQTQAEDAIDPDEKADQLEELVEAANDARGAIGAVLEERANAAGLKRTLDATGVQLRALAAEHARVRVLCGLAGTTPQVPSSEPSLGSPEGPTDTDLLEALFATQNVAILIDDVRADYVSDVLETLDPLLDASPDADDIEDALDEASDALGDLAETIDRAIDLHLGALDALEMTLPTDDALVEDREDETATAAERSEALRNGDVAGVVLRTNVSLARTAINTARSSIGHDVRFTAPSGVAWPGEVLVVGAGADPGTPLARLASNGTTRLIDASYDVYAADVTGRYLLRAGVPIGPSTSSAEIGGRVRADEAVGPVGWEWGVVAAGGIVLADTPRANASDTTILAPVGSHAVFLRKPGSIETFLANVTVAAGGLAEIDALPACRASAGALVLDIDGDGIAFERGAAGNFSSAPNATIRWPSAGDDALVVADGTALRVAGWTLREGGVDLDGLVGLRANMTATSPAGVTSAVTDVPALLALLDANADGKLSSADAAWSTLKLWTDANGDGVVSAAEVEAVDARAVDITTTFGNSSVDAHGDLLRAGKFTRKNGTEGLASDVHFALVGRCGQAAPPAPPTPATPTPTPTPTPTVTTPTASPTPTTTPEPTAEPTTATSATPTASPSGTPVGATPTPTPGEQEPQGPIPGAGLALVLAALAAVAVLARRRG